MCSPADVLVWHASRCRAALTSGASQWRQTQDAIVDVHEKCKARGMRMVLAVVGPAPDTAAVLGEFEAAVTHKTLLEPRFILRLATAPTQPEARPRLFITRCTA